MIFTEDVEHIFGKRPWTSRTDEILAAKEAKSTPAVPAAPAPASDTDEKKSEDSGDNSDGIPLPPPFKGLPSQTGNTSPEK